MVTFIKKLSAVSMHAFSLGLDGTTHGVTEYKTPTSLRCPQSRKRLRPQRRFGSPHVLIELTANS